MKRHLLPILSALSLLLFAAATVPGVWGGGEGDPLTASISQTAAKAAPTSPGTLLPWPRQNSRSARHPIAVVVSL